MQIPLDNHLDSGDEQVEQELTETPRKTSRMDPFYKAGRYIGKLVSDKMRFYGSQIPISAPPGMNVKLSI